MSIIVVNVKDNRAVFRTFIALLSFSFDSPSYISVWRGTEEDSHTVFMELTAHQESSSELFPEPMILLSSMNLSPIYI